MVRQTYTGVRFYLSLTYIQDVLSERFSGHFFALRNRCAPKYGSRTQTVICRIPFECKSTVHGRGTPIHHTCTTDVCVVHDDYAHVFVFIFLWFCFVLFLFRSVVERKIDWSRHSVYSFFFFSFFVILPLFRSVVDFVRIVLFVSKYVGQNRI